MSIEQNKVTVRRYYDEVLNQGDIGQLEELAVTSYIEHNPLPGQTGGLEGLRQRVQMLLSAFRPRFTVEDIIAEGDRVAVRWTHRGTHVGAFMGIPATSKQFVITGMDIHGLENGRMAEHWDVVDQLSFLQQLGLVAQPDQGSTQEGLHAATSR